MAAHTHTHSNTEKYTNAKVIHKEPSWPPASRRLRSASSARKTNTDATRHSSMTLNHLLTAFSILILNISHYLNIYYYLVIYSFVHIYIYMIIYYINSIAVLKRPTPLSQRLYLARTLLRQKKTSISISIW